MLTADSSTLAKLQQLGTLNCTDAESAAFLGVTVDAFTAFISSSREAAEAMERGRLLGNVVLRQRQAELSKTSPGMAIHLGKERLKVKPAGAKTKEAAGPKVVPLRGHKRPAPPQDLIEEVQKSLFVPAPDLAQWLRLVFIEEGGPLHNPEHAHLVDASIGVLWTNVSNGRQGRRIVGQAELGGSMGGTGGKWQKGKVTMLLQGWFGSIDPPDFVMTLDANYADQCEDASFCALVEHELYHMAQATDEFGMPKFNKDTGRPMFAMRGHDVEEFVGVVRRYGANATGVSALIEAANRGPEIASASLAHACGTCQAKRAA